MVGVKHPERPGVPRLRLGDPGEVAGKAVR
jgi:hypothetical protein